MKQPFTADQVAILLAIDLDMGQIALGKTPTHLEEWDKLIALGAKLAGKH